jgi:hypothetical protein
VPADPTPVRFGRVAGAGLVGACLLLLGFTTALLVEDRGAVTTVLIVFALVSVPALISALLGLRAGVTLLRGGPPENGAAFFAGALAAGHIGVVAMSLRPGLDRLLDDGDLAGGGVGVIGAVLALVALALVLPGRSLGIRLVASLGLGVLALALLVLRAVAQID